MMRMGRGKLAYASLIAVAALGTGSTANAGQEIHARDIRAQQPQELIYASAPCQRARKSSQHFIWEHYAADPRTLAANLNTLMEESDEVVLAAGIDFAAGISPNGKRVVTYEEARVVRSWKGPHHPGDTLMFGVPFGNVSCEPTGRFDGSTFNVEAVDFGVPATEPFSYVWVLFLRQSKGDEKQWVQGLRLAAGEGLQGMFTVKVPPPTTEEPDRECSGNQWSWQRCDLYLGVSQIPVMIPYVHDPLSKTYAGMPVSDFLRQVQSVAGGNEPGEKSSSE